MRVSHWNNEVFKSVEGKVQKNANDFMDMVVADAKRRCPVDPVTVREGRFASANISFTPKTGSHKGMKVTFSTDRRWYGREPGDLRRTIRRVNKDGSMSVRVYAGNFKIYWAFMVERGTSKTKAQPFLRPAFFSVKNRLLKELAK